MVCCRKYIARDGDGELGGIDTRGNGETLKMEFDLGGLASFGPKIATIASRNGMM